MELPSHLGAAAERLSSAVAQLWAQSERLHTLVSPPSAVAPSFDAADLLLERFEFAEAVSEPFVLTLQVLMLDAHVPLKALCGQPLTLRTRLADGQHTLRSGIVTEVKALHADGGFARKSLTVRPWLFLLSHTLHSRVWQDQSVIAIVEDVFSKHPQMAVWRWDDGVEQHVAQGMFAGNAGCRAYCVQYRESDLDLVQRLLVEEGIGWRVEERPGAPAGHGIVFFVSSTAQPPDPTSACGVGPGASGIRYHASPGHDSQEEQDSIHALGHERRLGHTAHAVLGWDPQANAAIAAEVASMPDWGPEGAAQLTPWLSQYDPTCGILPGTPDAARFAATLLLQAEEARRERWIGRGNVRTLRAGSCVSVTAVDGLLSGRTGVIPELFVTRVYAVGANVLPKAPRDDHDAWPAESNADEALGHELPERLEDPGELHAVARRTGYACNFEAAPRQLIWRPALQDGTGLRLRHRPTVRGPQTAIVVGPKGQTSPDGADEIFTDAMGRIRVRFHWQSVAASSTEPCGADAFDSCWVRVLQRLSGPGMGHQFIPRIGQEVLVGFLGNDIDRPVVIGSLHNGQGESGIAPTPGGTVGTSATSGTAAEAQTIAKSTDHQPSGQMNLIGEGTGGHSPAWHGGAPGAATEGNPGQANAAALSGIKSKEFGGDGHNQLVLDDTPQQLRARLHTTQAQTWLEMGHLLHQADNHRGSLRGQGLELRTDAWGGLRAARGLLLSTYSLRGAAGAGLGTSPEPASDNAAGIALARQMQQLNQAFQQATRTHQTVGLATGVQASTTLSQSLRGSGVNGAAVPHMSDPHIALAGKAGVGLTVGQDVHLSSQGATTLASGQDSHWAVGGQARIHTGQAIGVLAGAVQAGSDAAGNGLTVIAAQGAVDLQAHAGAAQIAAQGAMELKTAHGAVNMAAAKKVTLAVSGGASLTIEGGSFTAQCPGKITVKAGVKSMVGPDQINRVFPDLPSDKLFAASYAVHDNNNRPVIGQRYLMTLPNGEVQLGRTNIEGETPTVYSNSPQLLELTLLDGDEWHQMEINSAHHESDKYWGNQK